MVKSHLNFARPCREPEYPKLMICPKNSMVVLFTEHGIGTVVNKGGSSSDVGEHYKAWVMKNFERYGGSVTLEN